MWYGRGLSWEEIENEKELTSTVLLRKAGSEVNEARCTQNNKSIKFLSTEQRTEYTALYFE